MEEHNHQPHDHAAHDHHGNEHKKEGDIKLTVPGAIVLNGFIIAVSIIIAACMLGGNFSNSAPTVAPTKTAATKAVNIANVNLAGQPFVGSPQAPVVMAYWSDYQCPFCKVFEQTTFQTILKDYVEPGKVAVAFKDFSFLGDDSTIAALYGRAVWELYPETYFAWREAMFKAQDGENAGFGNEESVVKLTATVPGMDAAKVKKLVADKMSTYLPQLEADRAEAASMGIEGTPSFIVGKTLIPGNRPLADFTKALDKELK